MILKFRAWDKEAKEMIEDVTSIHFKAGMIATSDLYFYPLDNIVLMQSTGLTDKNGKEIFIGDIFSNNQEPRLRVVSWEHYDYLKQYGKYGCEILGNIHENSDLIKEEN